ncbi:cation:proton antiporter domain-containing protein [Streptomyces sp. NPDC054765]
MLTPVELAAASSVSGVDPMARFLLAVAVVVLLSHLLGVLLGRLGQPLVIGEILGGLLLGPSALGWVWPAGQAWLLPPEVTSTLNMAAQLGLVTFMFLLGCELRMERTARTARTARMDHPARTDRTDHPARTRRTRRTRRTGRTGRTGPMGRSALVAAVAGGMGLPFLAGTGIAAVAPALLKGSVHQYAGYLFFFGLAMSVTEAPPSSFPQFSGAGVMRR